MTNKLTTKLFLAVLALGLTAGCNNGEPDVVPDSEKKLDHLIFKEICQMGTWNSAWGKGAPYTYDPYIVIENPTEKTLYLDGMGLAVSGLACNVLRDLTEGTDHRAGFFGAYILVRFPGNGTDYPVPPLSSVTLTGYAVDHTQNRGEDEYWNAGSFDLSTANFEWYTTEQIKKEGDFKDNEGVPNMNWVYPMNETTTRSLIPQYSALALVKIPISEDSLLHSEKYFWRTYWTTNEKTGSGGVAGESGGHAHDSGYNPVEFLKLPNDWVVDCVQLCPQTEFKWDVVAPALDKGSTSIMTSTRDKTTNPANVYGYSLYRRHDGKKYVDTNNSDHDFEKKPASLLKKPVAEQ